MKVLMVQPGEIPHETDIEPGLEALQAAVDGPMMPFFFMAMYERDGQPAEKILKNMIRHRLWPETRPYKTRNFYKIMSKKEEISIAKNQTAGSAGKAPAGKHPAGAKKPVRSKKGR